MIYDKKTFWKSLFAIIATMALMKVSGGAGYALVLPIALAAFCKKKMDAVLFWVLVSMTMLMGNYILMPKDMIFMIASKVIILLFGVIMILSLTSHRKVMSVAPFGLMLAYLSFMILSSAVGWSPIISFLKLFLFGMMYIALMGVTNDLSLQSQSNMPVVRSMVLAVAAFVIVGSVLLIPFPSISQLTGEEYLDALRSGASVKSLFKGIVWHSQSLGPMVAFLGVFIFADWVLCVKRFSWMHAVLLGLCPLLLYKTSSRTAMGSALVGITLISLCLLKERGIGVRWRAKVKSMLFMIVVPAIVAVVAVPSLRNSITRFALKTSGQVEVKDFTIEEAMSTRQFLIDRAMYNFGKSPLVGNGFQVSSEMQYTKIKSLRDAVSAPIEKGVWVVAVLEEGGIIGMFLFVLFAFVASVKLFFSQSYMAFSLFLTFLAINMGEFTIFSASGVGGFLWTIIFVGAAFDALRLREDGWQDTRFVPPSLANYGKLSS